MQFGTKPGWGQDVDANEAKQFLRPSMLLPLLGASKVIDAIIAVLNLEEGPEYHSSWQIFKNTICFYVHLLAWSFLNKNSFVLLAYQPQRPKNLLEIENPGYGVLYWRPAAYTMPFTWNIFNLWGHDVQNSNFSIKTTFKWLKSQKVLAIYLWMAEKANVHILFLRFHQISDK